MSRRRCHRLVWVLAVLLVSGAWTGCGSGGSVENSPEVFQNAALSDVGSLYESYVMDANKPPTRLTDFARYEQGMPTGYRELQSGNLVVYWGATLSSDGAQVLAYEKAVPSTGGLVLMSDGRTIQKMTPEQFQTAPKAGTTDSASDGTPGKAR